MTVAIGDQKSLSRPGLDGGLGGGVGARNPRLSTDRPAVRVRDLEKQLASHRERAVLWGGMFLFFGVLATAGLVKWRRVGWGAG